MDTEEELDMDDVNEEPEEVSSVPPPPPIPEDVIDEAYLDPREAEQRRLARRPDIAHLHDAVVRTEDGLLVFVPDVGENVILERRTVHLRGTPWLDTRILRVVAVDEVTGAVKLHDDALMQTTLSNFITAQFHTFKLPPPKGRWDAGPPIKAPKPTQEGFSSDEQVVQPPEGSASQDGLTKKGRGRPKGSKNRPRDVVRAEKAALADERRAKKAARSAKRK